tara:strand:+ start:32 stop:931 length:900 start_codon:yes stop_codon:yes gene_type:complete
MVLLGFLFALIGLNIQHDANHGSISKKYYVNRVLGMTQNFIGGSAIDWIHQHVTQHHIYTNDVHKDPDITGNFFLRLNPYKEINPKYYFQYIHIFLVFSLFGINYSIASICNNIKSFNFIPYAKDVNHKIESIFTTICNMRWILFPIILSTRSTASFFLLYTFLNIFMMYVFAGYYLAFFFILSHNYDGVNFYESATKQQKGFLYNQVHSSSNVGGKLLCFINGGLNYQIEHHLFPRINHCHYPKISPIVEQFCKKKGLKYTHFKNIQDNLASTLRHLKILGRPESILIDYTNLKNTKQ